MASMRRVSELIQTPGTELLLRLELEQRSHDDLQGLTSCGLGGTDVYLILLADYVAALEQRVSQLEVLDGPRSGAGAAGS
jgi:hypothetical protein